MKRTGFLLLAVALSAGGLYLHAAPQTAVQPVSTASATTAPAAQRPGDDAGAPDSLVAPDPVPSGASAPPGPPPAVPALEPQIREALKGMLDTSSEGLVVEEHNGGQRIRLQGRFRTAPVATIDERGEAHVTDYSWLPEE